MRSIATEISWLTPFLFQKFEESRAPSSDLASEISFEIGKAATRAGCAHCRAAPAAPCTRALSVASRTTCSGASFIYPEQIVIDIVPIR
jgi:hypothetical protein